MSVNLKEDEVQSNLAAYPGESELSDLDKAWMLARVVVNLTTGALNVSGKVLEFFISKMNYHIDKHEGR